MSSDQRIHIVGPGGSGKTYVAKALAKRHDLPVCHLDDVFWQRPVGSPNNEPRAEHVRLERVASFASQDRWIIEGVYTAWVQAALERATAIYFLEAPRWLRQWRCFRRAVASRDDWRGTVALLRYNHHWDTEKRPKALARLAPFAEKLERLTAEDLLIGDS